MRNGKRNIPCTWTILLFVLGLNTMGFGQRASVNQDRLNRDLRIMEGVLTKLLRGKTSRYYVNGKTKAVYLPGFGIVFHTNQEGPAYRNLNTALGLQYEAVHALARKTREQHDELREDIQEAKEAELRAHLLRAEKAEAEEAVIVDEADAVRDFLEGDKEKIIEEEKEAVETLKDNISLFFINYISAIGQLNPQDRIAVLVDLSDWNIMDSADGFLTGWVTKQDVDRYRQNRLKESELKNKMNFQLSSSDSDIDMDIDILSEIFDRAMDSSTWWGKSSNNGIYINGLGALLFMDIPSNYYVLNADGENLISIVRGKTYEDAVTAYVPGKEKSAKTEKGESAEERIQKVQDELFELMASYGHTVRLKSQESIVLNINLGRRTLFTNYSGKTGKIPSRLILQLKKQDLDEYNRGFITLDALKKRLLQQTY